MSRRPSRSRRERRLTTRRRNRTFPARACPAVAGFEDRQEGRQTPHGCWGLLAGGTTKGTTGHGTAAVRQPTGSAPIRNAVLRVHKDSSRALRAALRVNPELRNHSPILRLGSASSDHRLGKPSALRRFAIRRRLDALRRMRVETRHSRSRVWNRHSFETASVRKRLPRPSIRAPDPAAALPPGRASCRPPQVMPLDKAKRSGAP